MDRACDFQGVRENSSLDIEQVKTLVQKRAKFVPVQDRLQKGPIQALCSILNCSLTLVLCAQHRQSLKKLFMRLFSGYIIYNRAGEKFYSKSDVFCRFLYRASRDIGSKKNPFRPCDRNSTAFQRWLCMPSTETALLDRGNHGKRVNQHITLQHRTITKPSVNSNILQDT